MKKTTLSLSIAVLVVLAFAAWAIFFSNNDTPDTRESVSVVAIVNGEEISWTEFEAFEAQLAMEYGLDSADMDAETRDFLKDQVIDSLISQRLLKQAAEQANINVGETEVDDRLETIKDRFDSQEMYEDALGMEGLTEEKLRVEIADDMLIQAYLDQELGLDSVTATEEEILEMYEQAAAVNELPPLEEVYEEVEQAVIQQKQQELVEQHLQNLRDQAEIEILI